MKRNDNRQLVQIVSVEYQVMGPVRDYVHDTQINQKTTVCNIIATNGVEQKTFQGQHTDTSDFQPYDQEAAEQYAYAEAVNSIYSYGYELVESVEG